MILAVLFFSLTTHHPLNSHTQTKALAYHGNALDISVTVVMPVNAPLTKISRSKGFGATVITHGAHIGQSKEYAMEEYGHLEYINGKQALVSF